MSKLKEITCVLIGHSRIITQFWGYIYCARCEAQIGDTLAGAFDASDHVLLYHDCDTCRKAAQKCSALKPDAVDKLDKYGFPPDCDEDETDSDSHDDNEDDDSYD